MKSKTSHTNWRKMILMLSIILLSATAFANNNPLWMRYSSISPDGQNIVFSYKGDLYIVPSSGGDAKILTFHEAYDYRPIWSPDSKTIAFSSDRFGNFDIYTISVDGGKAKRITYHSANEYPTSFTSDGKHILFSAIIMDNPNNVEYPHGSLDELYIISVNGGREKQVLSTPARYATMDSEGKRIIYHDNKGMENTWRKHNTQGFARDIWVYDMETKKHTKLTNFKGDDRWPVFSANDQEVFFLSEQFGAMNVCKFPMSNPSQISQVSSFENHPVRFLTIADNGTLCYGYDGEIYTQSPTGQPQKVNININFDDKSNNDRFMRLTAGATEMDVSPDGKEVAFIVRGEVFVTAVDYGTTKRITNTPEQERSVSFSPDGRSLLYASERNGSWNLYQTKIVNDTEINFVSSSLLKETPVLEIPEETFQPAYSPDGKEVAFLQERVILKVINLKSKKVRTIIKGDYQYSYTDGDQHYQWSPDGNWFLVDFTEKPRWPFTDIILVDSKGEQNITNLTESGYGDNNAKWMMGGKMMIWNTDRHGFRSHGSWGAHSDVYAMFFTQEALDRFLLSKEELEVLKAKEKKEKEAKKKAEAAEKKDKKGKKDKKETAKKDDKSLKIDWKNLEDRKRRLTIHSSSVSDAVLSKDGEKLYYLTRFEGGWDLWVNDLRKNQTSLMTKLRGFGGAMQLSKDGKNLFLMSGGRIIKISTANKKQKGISYRAEFDLDQLSEKQYMYEHIWRQVKKKFYDEDMHGIDWDFYKKEYAKFLPYIDNNYDYAEMLSELLGELNASHTGSGYRNFNRNGDATAALGIFVDMDYEFDGVKIQEVIQKGPFDTDKSKVRAGDIIEKIDGVQLMANESYYPHLNHKSGKTILVAMYRPESNERWDEYIKPISRGRQGQLLYERWVKIRMKQTEELSGGKIGYVHVRSMNSNSYRTVYSEILGRNFNKEAVIIDTRFNNGGWLHNDLATLLSGKNYMKFQGRGTKIMGGEPIDRWYKPSAVLVNEGNYSDAHTFPFAYRANNIGPIIGMPVPGTSTSVWWETLQDRSLFFGIPQVKNMDMNGTPLENFEIVPDHQIDNLPDIAVTGRDQQLEKAVEVLLKTIEK